MKGKKGYPVSCVTKETVVEAAKERKFGGRADIDGNAGKRAARKHGGRTSQNMAPHKSSVEGLLPEGGPSKKHAGKSSRGSVHGKPILTSAVNVKQAKGHKTATDGIPGSSDDDRPRRADGGSVPSYQIINKNSGKVVGTATTLSGARASVDRRDNAHGSYIHMWKKLSP